jgi:adenosine deaminase
VNHAPVNPSELRLLPKAELHQHLDGALLPETAVELAPEAGMILSLDDARRRLVAPPRCRDQAELLTYFDLPIALLQTTFGLRRSAAELVGQMADDGVTYGEIRWAPRLHLAGGLSVAEVIEAVIGGVSERQRAEGARSPAIALIVTAMRSHPPRANVELAEIAAAIGRPIVAFDLAGPEEEYPLPPHAAAFRAAERGGLALTAHAGEVINSERVREALDLGVSRIAHGVTAADDPELLALLRERDVTLDLCPTSNVQAGIVPSLEEHPLADLHRSGVSVTISTDDRTVSNTTLSDEMGRVAAAQGISRTELAAIALNGFRRGFAPRSLLDPLHAAASAAWNDWVSRQEAIS